MSSLLKKVQATKISPNCWISSELKVFKFGHPFPHIMPSIGQWNQIYPDLQDGSKKLSGQDFEERDFGGPKIKQLLHFYSQIMSQLLNVSHFK